MSEQNRWIVEFESRSFEKPIRKEIDGDMIIGRTDEKRGEIAQIDLGPYGGAKKGVSRRHVTLSIADGHLNVMDMETPNGTQLNGERLEPNRVYPLGDRDTLVLGAFQLNVRIAEKPQPDTKPDTTPSGETSRLGAVPTPKTTDRLPTEQKMVLIVEDHTEVAHMLSMILQKERFATHISRDANRAMRFIQGTTPDAVLLDLMLPGMNGLEVCRYIRRDSSLDKTAIIFVSANRNPGTERAAYDAGADAFITKPVQTAELNETLKNCIRKRAAGEDVTRELHDKDVTKGLSESEILEMQPTVREDTIAIVVAGYSDRPFTMLLDKPMTLGRGAYANPRTHTDLSRFDAKEKGVSRVHAKMSRENNKFYVQDMDSMNGTFVNGKRIPPHELVAITSGQEIRLGQLSMTVYFMSEENNT